MAVLPTTAEVKTYLQIDSSVTKHDALIASLIPAAVGTLERMSGRALSSSSNQLTIYSTDGQSALVIHDRPYTDASRVVQLDGTTLTEGTDYWMLPDRRHPLVSATIQLRQFWGTGEWWKADPGWFDKNLDRWAARWASGGAPNNLSVNGIIGHPTITEDTKNAITAMTGYLFKQKDAAGNTTFTPEGAPIDFGELPAPVQIWLANWTIRTAVMLV